jgi:AcrR family transcriptional regulator
MDDIALAAGLSKGSVYRYFPDKFQLFSETVLSTIAERLRQGGGGTSPDRHHLLRRMWTVTADSSFRAAYRLSLTRDPALHDLPAKAATLIDDALLKPFSALLGQTERAQPHDPPLIRARLVVATLIGRGSVETGTPYSVDDGVAFLLRACELEPQSPQADGF